MEQQMEKTAALMESVSLSEQHTAQIEERVERVDQELEDVRRELLKTKVVLEHLKDLDEGMETAASLLTVVSVIPTIGTAASVLKRAIKLAQPSVGKAKEAAQRLENASKKVREKVVNLEKKVDKVDEKLLLTLNAQSNLLTVLGSAQTCIDSLPVSDPQQAALTDQMETTSADIDPTVRNFDKVQVTFLDSVVAIEKKVLDVEKQLQKLADIDADIKRVSAKLQPTIDTLEDIKRALKKTVKVPYGVKPQLCSKRVYVPFVGSKVVSYPCGAEPVYFRFTVLQVLNGPSNLIKPVMDLLENAVDKILQPLLRKLNLDISFDDIPGAEAFEKLRDQLSSQLVQSIDEFSILLADIESPMEDFSKEMAASSDRVEDINDRCLLSDKTAAQEKEAATRRLSVV